MSFIGKITLAVCLSLFGFSLVENAQAQVFGDETDVPTTSRVSTTASSPSSNAAWSNPRRAPVVPRPTQVATPTQVTAPVATQPQAVAPTTVRTSTTTSSSAPTQRGSVAPVSTTRTESAQSSDEADSFFIPLPEVYTQDRPTLDGVQRGRVSLNPILTDGDIKKATKDDELIFLYYKDFKIGRMMSGMVSCDVTFVVLTTLNRRLSNISYKLQWPDMGTSISMDNVAPNTETVISYTLLGDGCYSMDKIPNVVVNRCRVKGLTQQQCANKIRWVRK